MSIDSINRIIKKAAEDNLKAIYRNRNRAGEGREQPWMNDNIRKEIKERRKLNKIHRNWREDEEGRKDAWEAYQGQKSKVKELISKEMKQYEENSTEEIRSGGRKGALWEVVNKLRGINKEKEAMTLYNEEGKMVSGMELERLLTKYWSKIYKTHENRMGKIWTEEGRREYEEQLEVRREERRRENVENRTVFAKDNFGSV